MADEQQTKTVPPKRPKERSPSFPFIPLKTAAERLEAFEKYFGRHPTPTNKAGLAWGMKRTSSQSDQTLAALRSYGFIQYKGSGTERLAELTEEGRAVLETAPSLLQDRFRRELLKLQEWEQTQMLATLQRIAAMMDVEEIDAAPVLAAGAAAATSEEVSRFLD